jgi:hypothetical protein
MGNRATFTVHDQPSILPSHDRMKELTDLGRKKQSELTVPIFVDDYAAESDAFRFIGTSTVNEPDEPKMDWVAACAKDSPTGKGKTEDGEWLSRNRMLSSVQQTDA